jgi:hypothetical protein
MEQMRRDDPRLRNHSALLEHWHGAIGADEVTVKQVIDRATDYAPSQAGLDFNAPQKREFMFPEFREALLTVAGRGGVISGGSLGKWLGKQKGKIVNGLSFEVGERQQTWRVRQV